MSEFPMLGSRAFKYSPIGGSSYIKTPKSIIGKRAIINVKNDDEKCFLYSILAHFKKFKQNSSRVSQYKQHLHELRTDGINMPMKLEDITKFEKLNDLSINVYCIEEHGENVKVKKHILECKENPPARVEFPPRGRSYIFSY